VWSEVLIEARSDGPIRFVGIGYTVAESAEEAGDGWAIRHFADGTLVIADGAWRTYRLKAFQPHELPDGPARQVGIEIGADDPANLVIRSITWVPADAQFADAGHGVRSLALTGGAGGAGDGEKGDEPAFGALRRALFAHTPARLRYPVRVPEGGRLDLGLGSHGGETRFVVQVDAGGGARTVLDEAVPAGETWRQRSVDLAPWEGREVTLTLAAEGGSGPSIALWSAPTVSGAPPGAERAARADRSPPNVVFYVIDGASAAQMSVYGHNRETTPNLERLAAEGVVFERAYSNSTWTTSSTPSFMTGLHHSVLGGYRGEQSPVPEDAVTMAEHFHRAGYQTGVFTTNPNAGSLSNLQRGVDAFRDERAPHRLPSSKLLQDEFWRWRAAYPGGPYWVHFQTTDVHPPHHPPPPFAGLFATSERRVAFEAWMREVDLPFSHDSDSVHEHYQEELAEAGIPPAELYGTMRDVHDEAMAHQDHQIGRLVERLKATGEWERTILVIASDHGHPAASYPRFGRGLLDPQPPAWEGALLSEHNTHIPLIVVWPGRIEGGRRIAAPVSMIDVLPTLLDLAGLPPAEVSQGRSLAPVLRGEEGWEPGPVIFDEFRVLSESGELVGNLEILDGRWGASLELSTTDARPREMGRHPAPAGGRWPAKPFPEVPSLLLYDLWHDPLALSHVTGEHPERVESSLRRLWELWRAQRALAQRFQAGEAEALSPEQLESLRALGYIQ
jgi:arylsulfatase A-like enzyme